MIGFRGLGLPWSDAQRRFAAHVWGHTPHLDFINGERRCVGMHIYAYGESPTAAFEIWRKERDARDDWEKLR